MNISPIAIASPRLGAYLPQREQADGDAPGRGAGSNQPAGNPGSAPQANPYLPPALRQPEAASSLGATRGPQRPLGATDEPAESGQGLSATKGGNSAKALEGSFGGNGKLELSPEENARVEELKRRDTAVRRHEQAHVAAAGRYARGGANFQYVLGPDGKLYAVGGEVQIDTSEVPDDPQATIQKAQTVRRAALAPSNPSSQDQRVAAAATQMEFNARMELAQERAEKSGPDAEENEQNDQAPAPRAEPAVIDLFA
ncbi:MAG: hypothetical protein IH971_00635 [Candidatus Marinimicrobia bacterium]|nr:hypothetical protein [Candidatus Neomarinimicrobiota bacterium]